MMSVKVIIVSLIYGIGTNDILKNVLFLIRGNKYI